MHKTNHATKWKLS